MNFLTLLSLRKNLDIYWYKKCDAILWNCVLIFWQGNSDFSEKIINNEFFRCKSIMKYWFPVLPKPILSDDFEVFIFNMEFNTFLEDLENYYLDRLEVVLNNSFYYFKNKEEVCKIKI